MYQPQARSRYGLLQNENERLKEENSRLRTEVGNLRNAFIALHDLLEISANITPDMDVYRMLDKILEAALYCIEAQDGSLLLVDEEQDELAFVVVHGSARDRLIGHRIPIGTGIAGWVAKSGDPVIVPNVSLDPRFSQVIDRDFAFKTHSLICSPLSYGKRVLGVIQGLNKQHGKSFSEADLMLLSVVGQLSATAIFKAEEAMLEEDALEEAALETAALETAALERRRSKRPHLKRPHLKKSLKQHPIRMRLANRRNNLTEPCAFKLQN